MANKNGVKRGTKIELRDYCKECGAIILDARYRTFCGDACRAKFYNKKDAEKNAEWRRAHADKLASAPAPGKTKCWICGNWYDQVGSHVHQRHGMAAKAYREKYGIAVPKRNRKKVEKQDLTPPADSVKL